MAAYSAGSRQRRLRMEEHAAFPESDSGWEEQVASLMVREPIPSYSHGAVQMKSGDRLFEFVAAKGLGRILTHAGFVLSREPATVRGPDVALVASDRLGSAPAEGFAPFAPDLAVEIV